MNHPQHVVDGIGSQDGASGVNAINNVFLKTLHLRRHHVTCCDEMLLFTYRTRTPYNDTLDGCALSPPRIHP